MQLLLEGAPHEPFGNTAQPGDFPERYTKQLTSTKLYEASLAIGYDLSGKFREKKLDDRYPQSNQRFETTQWSLVVAAGAGSSSQSKAALEDLCARYWMPLYAHVRRMGKSPDEASDLTQGFFAKLIEKNYAGQADSVRGRFRTFLLSSLTYYVANEWDRARAEKRGGTRKVLSLDFQVGEMRFLQEPQCAESAERQFERDWAVTLLERVLDSLEAEYDSKGKSELFDVLRSYLTPYPEENYAEAAKKLGLSRDAIKVAVHRMRLRYRQLLREEIASTVIDREEVDDEVRRLFATFERD